MEKKLDISVVVPLLNEEESLPELLEWIQRVMKENGFAYEVVFVNDGSTDGSWRLIRGFAARHPEVKGICFSCNYGKSAALNEGFKLAQGEVVITMDADLQDSPDEIPKLYKGIVEGGYDLISGWKKKRYDPLSKTIPSKLFNWVNKKISGIELHDQNCGLKAYRKIVVKNVSLHGEMHRYIPVLAKWRGFNKIGEQVVEHRARKFGSTKFGLERFINGFLDLLSITFVTKFRKRPMHFFGTIGTLSFLVGFVSTCWIIGAKLYNLAHSLPFRDVTEQPLFYISLTMLIVGAQMFLTGFIAEMMAMNSHKEDDYLIVERAGDND
ncbi:MAG: glycosyltransferase family 2 protein [Cytophagales bacterium]|nr:glycosyltransferase family 2 protein [Cytophagales bacterium]